MRAVRQVSRLVIALCITTEIHAQEIDLSQEMRRMLFSEVSSIPLPLNTKTQWSCLADDSIGGSQLANAIMTCSYRFDNIRTISSTVDYSSPKSAAIPQTIVKEVWQYKNCENTPLPITDTISLNTVEGVAFTNSTQVTNNSTSQTTTGITIPVQAVAFNYSKMTAINFTKQEQDSKATNFQESRTTNQNINISVPPRSIYSVTLEKVVSNAYIDFDGIVTLDADVVMKPRARPGVGIVRDTSIALGKLSSFTTSGNARMVHLRGQIWNAKGMGVSRTDSSSPILENSTICNASATPAATNGVLPLSQSAEPVRGFKGPAFLLRTVTPGIITNQPLTSGMSITTSNSIANVQVRAKSLGPGFCAVGISSSYGQANFLAPPLTWSPWTFLFSHSGVITSTIMTQTGCNTGALFEVQYFK